MKSTKPHWIAIGLLSALLLAGVVKVVVLGSTGEKAADGRTALLLESTQSIVEALANDDLTAVEAAARPIGSAAIATVDFSLRAKLPLDFKKLGFGTHYAFDDIANMANEKQPAKAIQMKLAETMNNCLACHAAYYLPE